ncbi:MAG TPA: non-homologous end-joining DNA ligase [Streptosporangiaceae bacterium]|jgi:bifunctional non-homologous end joining protein LigD
MADTVQVTVEDRNLKLSNLHKVLYPADGVTKAEVIDYYQAIAPVLLPHLDGRPLTVKRFPDGVDGKSFFEKNAPRHKPPWVRTVRLPVPGSTMDRDEIDFIVVEGLPTLVWLANLAALELHVPQWTVGPRGGAHGADLLVFDLDPGTPATAVECARVAMLLRDVLAADGLDAYPKSSGKKGMQLYVPIHPAASGRTSEYAKSLAERLTEEHPDLVVARMEKRLRPGKVLIDWSQNNPAKTTVAVYSLRAADTPTVSAPLTWAEVENATAPADLRFTANEVRDRVEADGDLFAPLLAADRPHLPETA